MIAVFGTLEGSWYIAHGQGTRIRCIVNWSSEQKISANKTRLRRRGKDFDTALPHIDIKEPFPVYAIGKPTASEAPLQPYHTFDVAWHAILHYHSLQHHTKLQPLSPPSRILPVSQIDFHPHPFPLSSPLLSTPTPPFFNPPSLQCLSTNQPTRAAGYPSQLSRPSTYSPPSTCRRRRRRGQTSEPAALGSTVHKMVWACL